MERQRNYCLATWDPQRWEDSSYTERVFMAFGFFAIRDSAEELQELSEKLNLEIRPWIKRGQYCVAFDYVAGTGFNDDFTEVRSMLWQLSVMGVDFGWCTDVIPEMPPESRNKVNTYDTLQEALEAAARSSTSSNPDPSPVTS